MGKQVSSECRADKDDERVQQRHDSGNFHLPRLHLLTEELRRTPYHQSTDEYSNDNECIVIHPSHADTAEPCVNLHIQHLYHAG